MENENKKPKLLIIFGPPAVGKLTVAKELLKISDFKLLHNHMVDDLLTNYFQHGSTQLNTLSYEFRKSIIEECIKSGMNIVFTFFWKFDLERCKKSVESFKNVVEQSGGEVFFVELFASLDTRMLRAGMEDRHKAKKAAGPDKVVDIEKSHITSTSGDFFYKENYLLIDNTDKTPEVVAKFIKEKFKL